MAEEVEVGCSRPTGGPVGEKAPDFVAPGYRQGKSINVKLSD